MLETIFVFSILQMIFIAFLAAISFFIGVQLAYNKMQFDAEEAAYTAIEKEINIEIASRGENGEVKEEK